MNLKNKRKQSTGNLVPGSSRYYVSNADQATYEHARDALATKRRHYGIVGMSLALAILYGFYMYGVFSIIARMIERL